MIKNHADPAVSSDYNRRVGCDLKGGVVVCDNQIPHDNC